MPRMASTLLLLITTLLHAIALAQTPRKDLEARGLQPLPGTELARLLPGNTLYHINPTQGVRVPLFYGPDGTRLVRIRGQVIASHWKIEGDRVCEYSVVLQRDVCRSLYRFEGGAAVCDEGSPVCDYGWDWAPGNAERLAK